MVFLPLSQVSLSLVSDTFLRRTFHLENFFKAFMLFVSPLFRTSSSERRDRRRMSMHTPAHTHTHTKSINEYLFYIIMIMRTLYETFNRKTDKILNAVDTRRTCYALKAIK